MPTLRFQVLYVFLVLAEWTGQQLRDAFPFDQLPRYLLRDRDAIFGTDFRDLVRDMGIRELLSAPRSPWQWAYIERGARGEIPGAYSPDLQDLFSSSGKVRGS